MEEKLKMAVSLAMGLDDISEKVLKEHELVVDTDGDGSSLSIGGNILIVTPAFIESHNMAQLVGKIMHEARHAEAGHGLMWREVRADLETHDGPVHACLRVEGGGIRYHAVRFIWNLVCDAVINADLKHVPVIRDSDGIQFGKYPLSNVVNRQVLWSTFYAILMNQEQSEECIGYLKEHGYWGTQQ